MSEAYPLAWPAGFSRAISRKSSNFETTPSKAIDHLLKQIKLLANDQNPIISSNVRLRKSDGIMYADMAKDKLDDPGVAVYFQFNKKQVVLACDAWFTPAENVRALGLTVEAMRGINRWGSSEILQRAFTGFATLPAPGTTLTKPWYEIMCFEKIPVDVALVKSAYISLSKERHPDAATGSHELMVELNAAYQQGLNHFNQ